MPSGRSYISYSTWPSSIFVFAPWFNPSKLQNSGLTIINPTTLEIELFIVLNSFVGAVKTWKST